MEQGLDISVPIKNLIENMSIAMISLNGMTTKAELLIPIHFMFLKD